MSVKEQEFSNPIAPMDNDPHFFRQPSDNFAKPQVPPPSARLTINDFRRILLTPRQPGSGTTGAGEKSSRESNAKSVLDDTSANKSKDGPASSTADKKRKRKAFYALKAKQSAKGEKKPPNDNESLDDLEEDDATPAHILSGHYRDRAKERRDGKLPAVPQPESLANTADYRAVAPSSGEGVRLLVGTSYAERRRQMIEESKYLGGDMEHTHLVKGLDYALLEKVRQEIDEKEQDEDVELQELEKVGRETDNATNNKQVNQTVCQSRIAKGICRVLFENILPQRNELFAPGRMAYRVDLSEEWAEFDVPATVIRSKVDCPVLLNGAWGKDGSNKGIGTTQEVVLDKVIQILACLRHGKRLTKKTTRKGVTATQTTSDDPKRKKAPEADMPIYDDVEEYQPDKGKKRHPSNRHSHRSGHDYNKDRNARQSDRDRDRTDHRISSKRMESDRHRERDRRDHRGKTDSSHEHKNTEDANYRSRHEREKVVVREKRTLEPAFKEEEKEEKPESTLSKEILELEMQKHKEKEQLERMRRKTEISGYDECYPGFAESYDAMGDSDDETDYSKMDLGNRKGPVGRWDFETVEEYSNYMSEREALPKAAFQYGVKMSAGRMVSKTKRPGQTTKDDVNRQWQQIQAIMQNKRKNVDGSSGEFEGKKPKY